MSKLVIPDIIEQYAGNAAFLWQRRDNARHAWHYSLDDLSRLDDRIDAALNALIIAEDDGWEISQSILLGNKPGEIFVLSILAFDSGNEGRIQLVLKKADSSPELACGVISALGWLSHDQVKDQITKLLHCNSANLIRIGIAACAAHKQCPGQPLSNAIWHEDLFLKSRALRAAGECGIKDLMHDLVSHITHDDVNVRFSAAWSAALLRNAEAMNILRNLVKEQTSIQEDALHLTLRLGDLKDTLQLQRELALNKETLRLAVMGAGIIGENSVIEWLIDQMHHDEMARIAGAYFSMATGVELTRARLVRPRPEDFRSGPTDDPEDEHVAMDPDDPLPWPDHQLVMNWWKIHQNNFKEGVRYLMGQPIGVTHLKKVLACGSQPDRRAAALELALLQPGTPLFDIGAPSWRQKASIAALLSQA